MALLDVTTLVQRVTIDRDMKLQILDLLAANPSEKMLEDIETLLRSYEDMSAQQDAALKERLHAIETAYQETVSAVDARIERDAREMQDDANRNEEIEKIRKSLM